MTTTPSVTPKPLREQVTLWQQGDFALAAGDLLFRDLPLNGGTAPEVLEAASEVVADESIPGFVVISQTCDIVRDPETHPYVSVCPLLHLDPKDMANFEAGRMPTLGFLPNLPSDLVVDFARTMTITKQLMCSWERQAGCETDADQLLFARQLTRVFNRFAFPDEFNAALDPFKKSVQSKQFSIESEFGRAIQSLLEFRVYPHGTWDDPSGVDLTIYIIIDADEDRVERDRNAIVTQLRPHLQKIRWSSKFRLHRHMGYRPVTLADIQASEYLNSFPLDLITIPFAKRNR